MAVGLKLIHLRRLAATRLAETRSARAILTTSRNCCGLQANDSPMAGRTGGRSWVRFNGNTINGF